MRLGIPASYDARYRVNCTVLLDQERTQQCTKGIERRLGGMQVPPKGWTASEVCGRRRGWVREVVWVAAQE